MPSDRQNGSAYVLLFVHNLYDKLVKLVRDTNIWKDYWNLNKFMIRKNVRFTYLASRHSGPTWHIIVNAICQ